MYENDFQSLLLLRTLRNWADPALLHLEKARRESSK